MHGAGIFTWADGRKYDGEYYDDKKTRSWSVYLARQKII